MAIWVWTLKMKRETSVHFIKNEICPKKESLIIKVSSQVNIKSPLHTQVGA